MEWNPPEERRWHEWVVLGKDSRSWLSIEAHSPEDIRIRREGDDFIDTAWIATAEEVRSLVEVLSKLTEKMFDVRDVLPHLDDLDAIDAELAD